MIPIPRTSLLFFILACEKKMREKDHFKHGWQDLSVDRLLSRLEEEVKELREALAKGDHHNAKRECADVGNFSMMIFDKLCGRCNHRHHHH